MIEEARRWSAGPTTDDIVGFSAALRGTAPRVDGAGAREAAELIGRIRALEELKSAAAAAQVRATARFAAAQRVAQRAAGVPAHEVGKGIGAQVALARRDSPSAGSRYLGLAEALVHEMPHTLAGLETGRLSEWRATLVVRETACLSADNRAQVDAELAARPGGLEAMGNQTIAAEARRIGYRLDPHAFTDRARKAESDRRVTLRPAPDTMAWLTGLLPVKQGVAAYAALRRHADSQRAKGDERSRGQIMADTLVERVTGQRVADHVPVEVDVVITDGALLGEDPEPADLVGYGPIPAPLACDWLRPDETEARDSAGLADETKVWLRRFYTDPESGDLTAMESSRRCFDRKQRQFVIVRDRRCRTPWCDAPIRHTDHPLSIAKGGTTTVRQSQGLCEACNYTKEAHGWDTRVSADGAVHTTTPTGHRYTSRPPLVIGRSPPTSPAPQAAPRSVLEAQFRDLVLAV